MLNVSSIERDITKLEKDIAGLNDYRKELLYYIADIKNSDSKEDFDSILRFLKSNGLSINQNLYNKSPFSELMRITTQEISINEIEINKIVVEIEDLEEKKEDLKNKEYYSDLADKMYIYKKIYIKENGFGKDDGNAFFEDLVAMVENREIKEFDLEDYGFSFINFERILSNNQKNKG